MVPADVNAHWPNEQSSYIDRFSNGSWNKGKVRELNGCKTASQRKMED